MSYKKLCYNYTVGQSKRRGRIVSVSVGLDLNCYNKMSMRMSKTNESGHSVITNYLCIDIVCYKELTQIILKYRGITK